MILTAQDIQSQQFNVRFRGFDVEEVDAFLEKISSAFQAVSEENQQLKSRLENLEKELATFHNQQKSFQNAIIAAQNVVDGMKAKSREEAEAIVAEAKEEARLRRKDGEYEIAELKNKIAHLQSLKEQARDDMRQQLKSYLRMLETEPVDNTEAVEPVNSATNPPQDSQPSLYGGSTQRARAASEPETVALPKSSRLASPETADLSGLYVKINIPDLDSADLSPATTDHFAGPNIALPSVTARKDMLIMDEEEETESMLPDLDGDMTFSLEDPLAGHEPAVSFAESLENAKGGKAGRFNPDKSPL